MHDKKYRQRMPEPEDTTLDTGQEVLTPGFLRFVGELLFGERWQTPLAQRLGKARGKMLAPATLHRWSTQTRTIPRWVTDALAVILDDGQRELEHRARLARQIGMRIRSPVLRDRISLDNVHDRSGEDAFG